MSRLPKLPGEEVVKVLGRKIGTVVPLNKELKPGTLFGVFNLAGISKDEFVEALKDP